MSLLATEHIENGEVRDADGRTVVTINDGAEVTLTNGIADTLSHSGTATAPAAFQQIADLAPPAGVYDVEATLILTGTAETKLQNVAMVNNVTIIGTLPSLTGQVITARYRRVTVAPGQSIYLFTSAAATAGAIYNGLLTATRIA